MRYVKQYMAEIAGIEIYPIISLLIFFIFFLGLGIYVLNMKRNHLDYMSGRPIESEPSPNQENR